MDQKNVIIAKEELNDLVGNIVTINDKDMALYESAFKEVFADGVKLSFMSMVFYATYTPELLIGLLEAGQFRDWLREAVEEEKHIGANNDYEYWEPSMDTERYGIKGKDVSNCTINIRELAKASYSKIAAANEWYGTPEGKEELGEYDLSERDIMDIKTIILGYPYLMRRYDYNEGFAKDIMEYTRIICKQICDDTEKEMSQKTGV